MTGSLSLHGELGLLWDFAIYGTRATGTLELDDVCGTTSFTKDFDPQSIRFTSFLVVFYRPCEPSNRSLST